MPSTLDPALILWIHTIGLPRFDTVTGQMSEVELPGKCIRLEGAKRLEYYYSSYLFLLRSKRLGRSWKFIDIDSSRPQIRQTLFRNNEVEGSHRWRQGRHFHTVADSDLVETFHCQAWVIRYPRSRGNIARSCVLRLINMASASPSITTKSRSRVWKSGIFSSNETFSMIWCLI